MSRSKLEKYEVYFYDVTGRLLSKLDDFTPNCLITGITIANARHEKLKRENPFIGHYEIWDCKTKKIAYTSKEVS